MATQKTKIALSVLILRKSKFHSTMLKIGRSPGLFVIPLGFSAVSISGSKYQKKTESVNPNNGGKRHIQTYLRIIVSTLLLNECINIPFYSLHSMKVHLCTHYLFESDYFSTKDLDHFITTQFNEYVHGK